MMYRRQTHNEQGSVVIIALGLLLIVAIIAVGLLRITSAQTKVIKNVASGDEALYSAEKVSNQFLWQFNSDQDLRSVQSNGDYERTPGADKVIYRRQVGSYEPNATYREEIIIPMETDEHGVTHESQRRAIVRITSWEPNKRSLAKTIEVEMVKRNFTQYGWITDSERDEENQPVYWREKDKFYGPLHTNGSLYLYYTHFGTPPAFYGRVTYGESLESAPYSYTEEEIAGDSSIFHKGAAKVEKLGWPASNTYLMAMAEASGGHYYKGRTCILLEGDSYKVRGYDSETGHWRYNNITYDFERGQTLSDAMSIYNDAGIFYYPSKGAYDGGVADSWKYPDSGTKTFKQFCNHLIDQGVPLQDNIDLPTNGVIYVDGDQRSESAYHVDTGKFDRGLGNVFVSGTLNGQLTIGAKNDIYITTYDPTDWRSPWFKPTGLGPVLSTKPFQNFEETPGLQYGSTTFTPVEDSAGDWDHEDADGSDMLGLAAQQNIRILHRSWPAPDNYAPGLVDHCSNWGWLSLGGIDDTSLPLHATNDATGNHKNITIQAAMFCNTGSFGFEDPQRGERRDTMYVVGSVAEKLVHLPGDFDWTATVNLDGYKRNITHDPRMTYMSPPYFIEPTQAGFQMTGWKESKDQVIEP